MAPLPFWSSDCQNLLLICHFFCLYTHAWTHILHLSLRVLGWSHVHIGESFFFFLDRCILFQKHIDDLLGCHPVTITPMTLLLDGLFFYTCAIHYLLKRSGKLCEFKLTAQYTPFLYNGRNLKPFYSTHAFWIKNTELLLFSVIKITNVKNQTNLLISLRIDRRERERQTGKWGKNR